jgi:hypothetical protein
MSQAYVLVFGRTLGTRQQVQEVLTAIPGVTYWYACLPYCIFVTSTLDAGTLAKRLEERLGVSQGQRFLVARVSPIAKAACQRLRRSSSETRTTLDLRNEAV